MLAKLPAHQKVLLDAADYIEKHGLAKNVRQDKTGAVCVHGAISMICNERTSFLWPLRHELEERACKALANYLLANGVNSRLIVDGNGCGWWNNQSERTKEEVMNALRGAALT